MNMLEDIQKLQFLQNMMNQQGPMSSQQGRGMPQMVSRTPDFAMTGGQQQEMPEMQQQQNSGPQYHQRNPLGMGAFSAIEAAKKSLEMNEQEKRSAMGRALINFSSAMGQNAPAPNTGIAGALGMINAGFAPAVNAYDAERDRIAQLNHMMLLQQKEEERYAAERAQKIQEQKDLMEIRRGELETHKGLLNLKKQSLDQKKGELSLNDQELLAEGVTPLSSLKTAQERKEARNHIKQYTKLAQASKDIIEGADFVVKTFENNPKLSEHWGVIAQAALNKDPSIIRQKLSGWGVPDDVKRDAWIVFKTLNDLVMHRVEGLPVGVRPSVFLEQLLKDSTANPLMPFSAIKPVLERTKKSALENYEDGAEVVKYGSRNGVYYPELRKIEEQSAVGVSEDNNPADALSTEQLLELRRQKAGG